MLLNSRLKHLLGVVQDRYKSVFRIEVPEPYPQTNIGQNIRHARGPANPDRYIYLKKIQSDHRIDNISKSILFVIGLLIFQRRRMHYAESERQI